VNDNAHEQSNGFTIFVNEKGVGALLDTQNGLTYSPSMRGGDPFAVTEEFLLYLDTMVNLSEGRLVINPSALHHSAKPSPVEQVREVEVGDKPRPSNVSDLNPRREPHVQTMSETPPSSGEMQVVIVGVERGQSKLGLGYKLYRADENGQRSAQSVGAVWKEPLVKGLEAVVQKNIAALGLGDVTTIPPIVGYYVKGAPTGKGGFFNDFVRFEVAS
jgi:hypothetical protein